MANIGIQTSKQRLVEDLYSLKLNKRVTIEEVMKYLYIDKEMTMRDIQKELYISLGTVKNWLDRAGISSKKIYWL